MPDPLVVGETGLPLWRYADWRAFWETRWRAAYGPDADTRAETPFGLVVDTLTLGHTLQSDALQSVWASSFFRTASGVALDQLLDIFGRVRLPALPTSVTAIWYGDATTVVWDGVGTGPAATVSSAGPTDGDRYVVQEAGTIPAADDAAVVVYEVLRAIDGDTYGIEFDDGGGPVSQTFDASSTSAQDVAEGLASEIVSTWPDYTVTTHPHPNADRWVIVIQGSWIAAAISPASTDPGSAAVYGGVALEMAGAVTGPRVVLAGTLIEIAAPATGLQGIVNPADGTPGRDRETDVDFRARHLDTINVGGRGTPQRIRAAVLSELPDPLVEYCRVDENVQGVTIEGRPGHSFEVTWIGTATAQQVGEVVFIQKPAGIRAWGGTEVTVEDEVGELHRVGVSPGTELYLHLEIEVTAGEGFPSTGDPEGAILEAVVDYLDDALGLGQDFYRVAVNLPILLTVPGISAIVITADATAAPGDPPTLAAADITVASNEILRVSSTRITVAVV